MEQVGRQFSCATASLVEVLGAAIKEGNSAVQITLGAPGQSGTGTKEEHIAAIQQLSQQAFTAIHSSNIINLVTEDEKFRSASRDYIVRVLTWAEKLGFSAVVAHVGRASLTSSGLERAITNSLLWISEHHESQVKLLIENSPYLCAPGSLPRLNRAIARACDPRMGICLDTCHAWSAGFDVFDIGTMSEWSHLAPHVGMLHLNPPDAKTGCGSGVHGHGTVRNSCWTEGDLKWIAECWSSTPMIMESGDCRDVEALRRWVRGEVTPAQGAAT